MDGNDDTPPAGARRDVPWPLVAAFMIGMLALPAGFVISANQELSSPGNLAEALGRLWVSFAVAGLGCGFAAGVIASTPGCGAFVAGCAVAVMGAAALWGGGSALVLPFVLPALGIGYGVGVVVHRQRRR